MRRLALITYCLAVSAPTVAMAQSAAKLAAPAATLDPATLKLAREVVAQMQGDRTALLNAMAAPMVGMMQQIGVKQ
ncbi:hypothetical protein [Methylobacterium sp. WL119]|uniref:hypothetical protein n=1 Tax=Methylobacterium sp. WL119 TaxID=2603888 RepID=UPI001FED2EA7|nr:hypothetical protein [Methylobacterium sp. WL119]